MPGEGSVAGEAEAGAAVVFDRVSLAFDEQVVLRDVSFQIPLGGMRILLGDSGAGKSVVLKLILGLLRPDAGAIVVRGQRVDAMPERDLLRVRGDIGMLFQENALFDSLTVDENVGYRLYEETAMPRAAVRARVEEVLTFVGLRSLIDAMPATFITAEDHKAAQTAFMVLHDRRIRFHGRASELLASEDRYLQDFLFRTLPPW